MYPFWLLVAFVGILDCAPVEKSDYEFLETCPSVKMTKLVHAGFLTTGCAKGSTGTASDKLCTLYKEILKQLCTSVKDQQFPFSDVEIEKELQLAKIKNVCDLLNSFKLEDVARTKDILSPVADVYCFRACLGENYTILPICNYGAYMMKFINNFLPHSDLVDTKSKNVENKTIINFTNNTASVPKTAHNNSNFVVNSPINPSASKMQLQPRTNIANPDNKSDPTPQIPSVPANNPKEVNDEKKAIITANNEDKNELQAEAAPGVNGLRKTNMQTHVNSHSEVHKNVFPAGGVHKEDAAAVDVIPPKASSSENLDTPKIAKDVPKVNVSKIDQKQTGNLEATNVEKPQEEVATNVGKSQEVAVDVVKPQEVETNVAKTQEAIHVDGVNAAGGTVQLQNPQGQNIRVVDSPVQNVGMVNLEGQNVEMVNPQGQNVEMVNPQGQLASNDFEDEDEDFTNEITVDNVEKSKPVEKKPMETEYTDMNVLPVSYKTENINDGDSYFFSYFMVICLVFIGGYVIYHNKQRILALIVEGRKGRRGSRSRRPNSANYKKLDTNLEEAISSSCNKSATHVIY